MQGRCSIDANGVETIFDAIFGVKPTQIVATLLRETKLPVGFEAQEFGRGQPSVSSSGCIVSAMLTVPEMASDTAAPLVSEIEGWIDSSGALRPPGFRPRSESTWANAQCLLALCRRPELIQSPQRVSRLVTRLEGQRRSTGGWPLRPGLPAGDDSFLTLYPVLALAAAERAGVSRGQSRVTLQTEAARLRELSSVQSRQSPQGKLISLALLHFLSERGYCDREESLIGQKALALQEELWRMGRLYLNDLVITDDNQPIWYAKIFRPSLYLSARRLWPVGHPVPTLLAEELRRRFDVDRRAWGHPGQPPLSWATALGLQSGLLLSHDLLYSGISVDAWKDRVRQLIPPVLPAFDYDVVISFSGQQREVAEEINETLKQAGLVTFYDYDHEHELLSEDLSIALQRIYFSRSRYAVTVLSRHFVESRWAGNWEWRAILSAMQQRTGAYLLPYFYEEVEVPGLNPAIGYVSRSRTSPREFAELVVRKVRHLASGEV